MEHPESPSLVRFKLTCVLAQSSRHLPFLHHVVFPVASKGLTIWPDLDAVAMSHTWLDCPW